MAQGKAGAAPPLTPHLHDKEGYLTGGSCLWKQRWKGSLQFGHLDEAFLVAPDVKTAHDMGS